MNTVVYYPHIYPQPEWLRLAALCWDKVYVLGARQWGGSTIDAEPAVAEIDRALGGILDTSIVFADFLDEKLEEEFKQWVEAHENELKRQGLSDKHQPLFGLYDHKFKHEAPTEESLRDWLVKKGLARIQWADKDKYSLNTEVGASMYIAASLVYLPTDIALQYLSLCASKVAAQSNRDLVAGGERFTDIVFHDYRALRGTVASAILEAYVPENFETMELNRLAALRHELASSRLEFQKDVQAITKEFSEIASEGQMESVKKSIVDIAKKRIDRTAAEYRRAKVEAVLKGFSVSLAPPALVATIASALGVGLFAPAAIASGLLLSGAGVLSGLQKARSDQQKGPWSYVMELQKQ